MLTKNNWQKAFDMLNEYANVDDKFYGGVCSYKFLSFEGVKKLVENKYLNLTERQNYSPMVKSWIKFIENNNLQDKVFFHGYIVEKNRFDRRISIEGIQADVNTKFSKDELAYIIDFCYGADTLKVSPLYIWWD